jgi:hypothetical protein
MSLDYDRIGEIESNVKQTTELLNKNVEKVIERGERLENITERSELLHNSSHTFRSRTTQLRRKMWLKNRCLVATIVVIGLAIVALIIILVLRPWDN